MQNLGKATVLKRSHDEYIVKNEIQKRINLFIRLPRLFHLFATRRFLQAKIWVKFLNNKMIFLIRNLFSVKAFPASSLPFVLTSPPVLKQIHLENKYHCWWKGSGYLMEKKVIFIDSIMNSIFHPPLETLVNYSINLCGELHQESIWSFQQWKFAVNWRWRIHLSGREVCNLLIINQ